MNQSRHHLAEVIGERTLHIQDGKHLAQEVAAYLLEEHQTASLESLIRDIMQYRADHGADEVVAVSSHELGTQVADDVRSLLHQEYPAAKSITVNEQIDSSVIGGVRIDQANEQLDLTVRAKINKFKRLTGVGEGY